MRMSQRQGLPQTEPLLGIEFTESLDLIFEFFVGARGVAASEPVLIEDCETAFPALILP